MTEKSVLMTEGPPSYPGVMVHEPSAFPKPIVGNAVRPQNYLGLTFFALLCCCCWPAVIFAVVGFVFSMQVDSQYTNKDFLGAKRSSNLARNWSIAAIATGLVTVLVYLALRLVCYILEEGEEDGSGHDMD